MRLSEAILLGSTVLTPKAGQQYDAETRSGCALGMAAVAKGCTFGPLSTAMPHDENGRSLGTAGVWGQWVNNEVARPCNCWNWWLSRKQVPKLMPVKDAITHIFDRHVLLKKDWTLDELVA